MFRRSLAASALVSFFSRSKRGFFFRFFVCVVFFLTLAVFLLNNTKFSLDVKERGNEKVSPQCSAALQALVESAPAVSWPPPCPLDPALRAAFEGPDGSMPITKNWCLAQRYEGVGERVLDWNNEYVVAYCSNIAAGREFGSYKEYDMLQLKHGMVDMARRGLGAPSLASSVGMVIGSERPWVECIALNLAASTVWTFEYGRIVSTHPRLKAKPYKEIATDFAAGKSQLLDWIVSYSSLEHSGLGRYGDALNPEGDTEALAQAWCMLKPGGVLLLAFGMTCQDQGHIEFNAHRVYGFKRLAHVARGFELIGFTSPSNDACNPLNPPDPREARMVLLRKPREGKYVELSAGDFSRAAERFRVENF